VHLRYVLAFRYGAGGGLGLATGDMHRCQGAYPVTAVMAPPHAQSAWYVVMAVTFANPGRYYIGRAKISYTTNGHQGWQYQNLFTTMLILGKWPKDKKRVFANPCP
jgi:hypothetical protein